MKKIDISNEYYTSKHYVYIREFEGFVPAIYDDGQGNPTAEIGLALFHVSGKFSGQEIANVNAFRKALLASDRNVGEIFQDIIDILNQRGQRDLFF